MDLHVLFFKGHHNRTFAYAKDFDLCFVGESEQKAYDSLMGGIKFFAAETKKDKLDIRKILVPGTDAFGMLKRFNDLKPFDIDRNCNINIDGVITINNILFYREEKINEEKI